MFETIGISTAVREFNSEVTRMNENGRKNLEMDYEKLTAMECDDAARI
jgi:hypothetical protein